MEKYKNTFDTVNTRILMEISLGISVYYFFNESSLRTGDFHKKSYFG